MYEFLCLAEGTFHTILAGSFDLGSPSKNGTYISPMQKHRLRTAAVRNKTQKLSMPSFRKDTDGFGSGPVSGSGQLSSIFLNHAFSSWFALFDSSTFRMALETSATRGDPMGNTCRRNLWS